MNDFYSNHLRSRGYRMTPQRMVILRILNDSGRHLTPQEIYERARQALPGLTEATVYRSLAFLTGENLVMETHVGGGQLVYEIANHAHHHLVCRTCGQTTEIEHSKVEELYRQIQAATGYRIETVHLTFFGLCPACQ